MANAVFCHYMVGGMEPEQAITDVTQAKAMGCDAFALNILSLELWSMSAVQSLFDAAAKIGFKLFFSFDMTHFTLPSQFFSLLLLWHANPNYYTYNNLPFVSTFWGGTLTFGEATPQVGWQNYYHDQLAAQGIDTYFVPSFSDSPSNPSDFFDTFPGLDGVFNWDSLPWESEGKVAVNAVRDDAYMSSAHAAGKTFMMGISPLQFKHLDPYENWYRRGELSLAERIPQILSTQPHFVQLQTWNDGGESNYVGNVWPDGIEGSPAHAYIDGFDHSGWQVLLAPFFHAYKSGATSAAAVVPLDNKPASGVFWYRPILANAPCAGDPLGKPTGWENAEDTLQVAVMLSGAAAGATIHAYSGNNLIGSKVGVEGLNSWSLEGLEVGDQKVEVVGKDGSVLLSVTGDHPVLPDSTICNFNYAVVGME